MGAPEAVVWGLISGLTSMGFALAGLRSRRRARLVADTPTSPATRGEPGDRVEIRGRVVAEGATIEAPLSGRQAVWVHVQVSEEQGSSRTTLVESVRAVPFLVDDGSGRTARVEPRASSDGVAEFDATIGGSWDAAHEGRRERVEALLKKSGKTGYDPKRLTWSERAL